MNPLDTIRSYHMVWLLATPVKAGMQFPVWFTAVYVVGFIAAVSLGSLAWYNSRRPAGWEDKDRPGFVPDVSVAPDDVSKS
jgi:hypothetical protein